MGAEWYLIVGYVLASYFEIWIFLNFWLLDASMWNTQIVNSEVSHSSKKEQAVIFSVRILEGKAKLWRRKAKFCVVETQGSQEHGTGTVLSFLVPSCQVKSTWTTPVSRAPIVGESSSSWRPQLQLSVVSGIGTEPSSNYYWGVPLRVGALLCLESQRNCWVKWATASCFYTDHSLFWTAPCSFMRKPKELYLPFSRFSAAPFYSGIWGQQSFLLGFNVSELNIFAAVAPCFQILFPWVLANERLGSVESPPLEHECLWEARLTWGGSASSSLVVRQGYSQNTCFQTLLVEDPFVDM